VGFLYNECFSVAIDLGSSWKLNADNQYEKTVGYTYPFGVDPAWNGAANSLYYYNSMKMKMSVILGVLQMTLGIILSMVNGINHRSPLHVFGESLPQFLFLTSLFGYLVFMIIYKWLSPLNPQEAPQLLPTLVAMFLSPGSTKDNGQLYEGQGFAQIILLLVAFISVPWMLLAKPLVLRYQHNARKQKYLVLPQEEKKEHDGDHHHHHEEVKQEHRGDGHGEGENFDFADLMVRQSIHTIEFVLGAISNTASYLRLWALSLAHSELSEVFFDTVLLQGFQFGPSFVRPVLIFVSFAAWAAATFAVLLGMESLSAFLHALRLHW
jgi:V-type H+-transporting ATPase subunit a